MLILSNQRVPDVRKALIAGLDVASGARSKATYYHSKDEQIQAVQKQVKNLYAISKELPLILAIQKGATGFFIQEALLNEFKMTVSGGHNAVVSPELWDDERLRDNAVALALTNLSENAGIPYVLRMFISYRDRNINNDRSRRFALSYIWNHPNLEFVSVKYRGKLRKILTHIYGQRLSSILLSICKKGDVIDEKDRKIFTNHVESYSDYPTTDLITSYLYIFGQLESVDPTEYLVIGQAFKAQQDISDCQLVPEEVLLGLLSNPNHPQHEELWSTKERQETTIKLLKESSEVKTANQAVRETKYRQEHGIETVETSEVTDPIALFKTGYEAGFTDEITEQLTKLAKKNRYDDFPYENIGIVIDRSPSMVGHWRESKNTPRAISAFTGMVLKQSANARVEKTNGFTTDLASAFLNLLKDDVPEAVFILSDGYENSYDGLLAQVVDAYREREGDIPVYHVSPIGFAEANAKARMLGTGIASMTANHKTLGLQMQANLLEADTRMWLENNVKKLQEMTK